MKIQTKITLTYVVLAILIVASLGIITSIWMESYFKNRLIGDLIRQADLVLYTLCEDSTKTFEEIDAQVKFVSGLEHLRITLIDRTGNVIADSDVPLTKLPDVKNHLNRPEVQQALRTGIGSDMRRSATVNRDFLYMAKEVKNSPATGPFQQLQFIRLSVPYEQVQHQIDSIRSIEILTGFSVLVVIVLASIFVSRRLTSTITQIAHDVEKIRMDDFDAKIEIKSNDEIGFVAKAINEIVDKLKADIVQLKKLEQVRSQFLGNVSHELRTPLFSIQGYLETLLEGAVNDPSVNRAFLQKAQTNVDRLNSLLEDLINISQIESGEMKLSFRYFKLNEFLDSVAKEFEKLAASRNVHLKLFFNTTEADEVFGDKERLRQVLNNLLSNAINYNKEYGEAVLSTAKTTQGIQISVSDTGVGIPPEHVPRIFERFYRVDSDRSRALGGTGLGLAIVKHIIEAHGSRVQVESVFGEGSVFKFILKSS
jgi:two-component system phosphate regulon sensor histidine kinase PhoR